MSQPNRPAHVPVAAEWIGYKKMWALGEKNAQHNRQGSWRWWKADGTLFIEENYENGNQHGAYKRYFNSGSPAIEGNYANGKWEGNVHFYRSDTEANSEMPKSYSSLIRKITVRYANGQSADISYFLADGTPVDSFGRGRHPGTPETATLDPETGDWQLFEEQADGAGIYRQWSSETGKLVLVVHYQHDQLHGGYTKYYKNGDICKEGEYVNNELRDGTWHYYRCNKEELTIQFSYNENKKIWKKTVIEREGQAQEVLYFLKDGSPCNRNGIPVRNDIRVTDLFTKDPDKFLSEGDFATYLQRVFSKQYQPVSEEQRQARKADFLRYYGMEMPDELAAYFDAVESAGLPTLYANLHTTALPFERYRAWEAAGKNIAEQSILAMQRQYPFDDWVDWVTGGISLDALWMQRSGHYNFSYQYGLSDRKTYYWQHNQYDSYWGTQHLGVIAPNLSTFLFFCCVCHAHSTEGLLSDEVCNQQLRRLRPLIGSSVYNISYGYPLELQTDFWWNNSSGYTSNEIPCYTQFRSEHWWVELLRGEIVDSQISDFPSRRSLEHTLNNLPKESDSFSTKLNYLWKAFIVPGKDAQLQQAIALCANSASVLLQQHARLVQQLHEGRQQLGTVHIPTAQRRFRE